MIDHAALLGRCAKGDASALKTLFEAEAGRLIAVAERILRRRDLAEEAVQDAFIRIWRSAHQYAPDRGSARGWIYAVVRNRALNMLRDGRREETVDDAELDLMREDDGSAVLDDVLSRLDTESRLRACLEALDETKRRSILMAYILGYTHGEIAGRLGVPLGTAKAWVRRGLGSLRECME